MKYSRYAWLVLALLGATKSYPSYFSERNEVRQNRLLLGGGFRSHGIGFAYQRTFFDIWGGEGSVGFSPLEGFQAGLGGSATWRQDRRFRPRVYVGLSGLGGLTPITVNLNFDGDTARVRYEVSPGLSAVVTGGFHFRFWRGFGANYDLGYRQALAGGDYTILSTTDEKVAKRAMDAMTGSGVSFSGRLSWEF